MYLASFTGILILMKMKHAGDDNGICFVIVKRMLHLLNSKSLVFLRITACFTFHFFYRVSLILVRYN
jgi:hypothetical protein